MDIDGGKALRAAVVRVFDHPVIQRCQLHKIRNVADKLPDHLASTVTKRMRKAYNADSALEGEAQLEALAKELDRTHPGAAGSLLEGMADAGPHAALHQQHRVDDLYRANPLGQRKELAEREHGPPLVRRRDDRSRGQFRRVNGHLHLPALRAARGLEADGKRMRRGPKAVRPQMERRGHGVVEEFGSERRAGSAGLPRAGGAISAA